MEAPVAVCTAGMYSAGRELVGTRILKADPNFEAGPAFAYNLTASEPNQM